MPRHDSGVERLCGNAVSHTVGVHGIGPHIRETRRAVSVQEVNDLEAILGRDLCNATVDVEPGVCHWCLDHQWKDNDEHWHVILCGELPKLVEILDEVMPALCAWAMHLMIKIETILMQQIPYS